MAGTLAFEVDGIGKFVVRKRSLRDQFKIEGETSRVMGGPVDDDLLKAGALAYATLMVLTIEAPDGWDLDGFDPLNADDVGRIFLVHRRLRDAETAFREDGSRKRP